MADASTDVRNVDENRSSTSLDELPSDFSADSYLAANPDVAAAGMDAADHYRFHGRAENRPLKPRTDRSPAYEDIPIADDVFRGVHPDDHLFAYVRDNAQTEAKAIEDYLKGGYESAAIFAKIAMQYPGTKTVLEFASGYGRMTRHIKSVAPHLDVTVCDIHEQANRFARDNMGVRSIESSPVPEQFFADQPYDMTFALSLFSHLPRHTWTRWLRSLLSTLRKDGILAFTAHGRVSANEQSIDFDSDGFAFHARSEQADLDVADYGSAYVTPKFAFAQINSLGNARIVDFSEGHWWGHQDLYVIQRVDGYELIGAKAGGAA